MRTFLVYLFLIISLLSNGQYRPAFNFLPATDFDLQCLSPDGEWLASHPDEIIHLFNTRTGRLMYSFQADYFSNVHITRDNTLYFKRHDTLHRTKIGSFIIENMGIPGNGNTTSDFLPEKSGQYIFKIYADSSMVWSSSTKQKLFTIRGEKLSYCEKGNKFIYKQKDTVYLTDLKGMIKERLIVPASSVVAFSQGSEFLAFGTPGQVKVYNLASTPITQFSFPHSHLNAIRFVTGSQWLLMRTDSLVHVMDFAKKQIVDSFIYRKELGTETGLITFNYEGKIMMYDPSKKAFSDSLNTKQHINTIEDNGNTVLIQGENSTIIYSKRTRSSNIIEHHTEPINEGILAPNNRYAIIAGEVFAYFWDLQKGTIITETTIARSSFECSFSPNSRFLAMWDGRDISVFTVPQGERISRFNSDSKIHSATVDSSGKYAIVLNRSYAEVWDLATSKRLYRKFSDTAGLSASNDLVTDSGAYNLANGKLIAAGKPGNQVIAKLSGDQYKLEKTTDPNYANRAIIIKTREGNLIATVISYYLGDYIIIDKDWHYDGSPFALKNFRYANKDQLLSEEETKKFYVPGLYKKLVEK